MRDRPYLASFVHTLVKIVKLERKLGVVLSVIFVLTPSIVR